MLNNSNQISQAILNAMEIISDKTISNTKIASTIQGTIVECKDASLGKYLVKYQDSLLDAYSTSPSVTYNKDTLVYIFVPDGDLKQYKVILGTTKQLGTNYIENYIGEEYFDTGENLITSFDYIIKINSFKEEEQVIYDEQNEENNIISLSENLINEIKNANYLKMTGTVQTKLPYNQKENGHYGIKVTLKMKNTATGKNEFQDYYFDNYNFIGNPYSYEVASPQIVVCQLDANNFVSISKISLFSENFPNQNNDAEDDIFIYDFAINGSYRLNETEKSSVGIVLKAERGYTFGTGLDEDDFRPVSAMLRAKMKQVNLEEQNVKIYWFQQDLSITSSSDYYSSYGGMGWKCLNEKISNEDEQGNLSYLKNQFNSSYSINIKKEYVTYSKETNFKCVAVYDNKTYSKEFIIFNKEATYEVTLTSSEGTSFHYSAGHPNLICKVTSYDNNKQIDVTNDYTFKWQVKNYQNITTPIMEDKRAYLKAKEEVEKIENGIGKTFYLKDKCPNSEKTYEDFYNENLEIINNYENSQHLDGNILYNVNLQQIINSSTFSCSCYNSEGQLVGSASITIKNTLAPSNGYTLIINHGDQTFLYDEEGASLHSNAIDEPYQIFDLSYTLYYNGIEIKHQDLNNGTTVTWKVPIENTMLDMGEEEYINDTENNLPINIKNTYDNNLSNNNIYLIMKYKDQTFITKTNFTFSKQGQNGTNGTKYQFKIKAKQGNEPVITYKKEKKKWEPEKLIIQPELWNNGIKTEINGILSWKILKDNLKENKYSMLSNDFVPVIQEGSDLKDRQFSLENNYIQEGLSNIIEVQYSRNQESSYKYYADLPVISIIQEKDDYNIKIDGGFRYVIYKNDGTKPSYDGRLPFKVSIYKNDEEVTSYDNEEFTFFWSVLPTDNSLLKITSKNQKNKNNCCSVIPSEIFSKGNQVDNALLLIIKTKSQAFAQVHIPIHFMLNKYENKALNDWNGTAIEINDNDGYILTPQVGAGKKNGDNSFTGIVIGNTQTKEKEETGLFGYAAGARSIFLDADTGNATFGLPGKGQIKIDVKDQAIIQSGDYPKKGMKIQFSNNPYIKFGSGNFEVSPEGHIHAVGGGDIAGWQISNNALSKGYVTISSNNSNPKNKVIKVTDGSKDIFSVDYRGYLHSQQGDIAGWTIQPTKLYKNNVGMASTGTHAFWAGDNFYVNHDGYLFSKYGKIGGWNILNDRLVNDKGNVGMSTGITIGDLTGICFWGGTVSTSNQINLNFWVTNSGILHAKYGQIGAWKIANGGLYSDGTGGSDAQNVYTYDKKTNTYKVVKRTKTSSGIKSEDANNYTYKNTSGGVYVGADGIRFGNYFHVTQGGGLYATGGKIGDINIDDSGLSANNWRIDGSGTAYFTNAYINGSDIVSCALSGSSSGGGISGGGMRMGSGGAGSSYMNPGVKTGPDGQTWEDYIKDSIDNNLTRNKILNKLRDGNDIISLGYIEVSDIRFNNGDELGVKLEMIETDLNHIWEELSKKANKSDIPSSTSP